MDRIDLHITVPTVDTEKLTSATKGEVSVKIRQEVNKARKIQEKRFTDDRIYTNSQMRNKHVKKYCKLDPETERILKIAVDKYSLSARTYFRLIKVSRTIADLENSDNIKLNHMAEALQYRSNT